MSLEFPGKSGMEWSSTVDDPDLATVIRGLKQRGPRARLLAWRDGDRWRPLVPSEVNDYVRDRVDEGFTSKDFRTLHGTIVAARALASADMARSKKAQEKAVTDAVRAAADKLGNTPAVARSSYIDPRVFDRYRAGEVIEANGSPERALRRLILGEE